MGIFLVKMTLTVLRIKSGSLKMDAVLTKFQNLISLFRYLSVTLLYRCQYHPYKCKMNDNGSWRLSKYTPPKKEDGQKVPLGSNPKNVTRVASIRSSCQRCKDLTSCPPDKPCRSDNTYYRARCNRLGKCWCAP